VSGLRFAVIGASADQSAAAPTVRLRLRITTPPDQQVQSILLRCQIRIEPERRRYDEATQARLIELFGEPHRWVDTLKPFQLTHVTLPVRGFTASTEVDLPVELSYDLEVAVGKYLHALRDGAAPLVLLFSGTVFNQASQGLQVEQIPWDREAAFDLPVDVWRAALDSHHPGTGWLRVHRDTIDALHAFKTARGLTTWDDALGVLLDSAAASAPNGNGHHAPDTGTRGRTA
jgi:hypothetical protein